MSGIPGFPVVFLAASCTSDRPDRRAWHIACVTRFAGKVDQVHECFIGVHDLDLSHADTAQLERGGFYRRHPAHAASTSSAAVSEEAALAKIHKITQGATVMGIDLPYSIEPITARMRTHELEPEWDRYVVDVLVYGAGAAGIKIPQTSVISIDDVCAAFGLPAPAWGSKTHGALENATFSRDLYVAVTERATSHR